MSRADSGKGGLDMWEKIDAEALVARSEKLLGQCKTCRFCDGIQEITYLSLRVDEDVDCRVIDPGDRAFLIYKGTGRCTSYAPRLKLIKGGRA